MDETLSKQIDEIKYLQSQNVSNLQILRNETRALREDFFKAEEARLQERLAWERRCQDIEYKIQELQRK